MSVARFIVCALDDTSFIIHPVNTLQIFLEGERFRGAVQTFHGMGVLFAIQAERVNVFVMFRRQTNKNQSVVQ